MNLLSFFVLDFRIEFKIKELLALFTCLNDVLLYGASFVATILSMNLVYLYYFYLFLWIIVMYCIVMYCTNCLQTELLFSVYLNSFLLQY